MKTKTWEDPIVAEVSRAKEKLAISFHNNLAAMLQAARRSEKHSGHKLISLPASKPKTPILAKK